MRTHSKLGTSSEPLQQKVAFSIHEVAELTGLGRSSAYEAISTGELCARKRGGRTLVLAADLEHWLTQLAKIEPKTSAS